MYNLEWDILSVYPYKEENINEILCRIYSIINELKNNGQVLPPDLVGKVEKLINDVKAIEGKIDERLTNAVKELESIISNMSNTGVFPNNNITDPYINDYMQQLTAGTHTEHTNPSYYGKCELQVKNGVGTITGLLNIASTYTQASGSVDLIEPIIALKQPFGYYYTSTGYQLSGPNFQSAVSMPIVHNAKGNFSIDKQWLQSNTNNHKYISVKTTFPIVKTFVKPEHKDVLNSKISEVSYAVNEDTSCIVLSCDAHIRPTYSTNELSGLIDDNANLYVPQYINYLNTRLGAFATINNGDTLTESASGVNTQSAFAWMMDSVRKMYVDNTLFVLGNHDDQSLAPDLGGQPTITRQQFNRFMNKGKTGINFGTNNMPYFTADDTKGKCRHIIMNSHDGEGKKIGLYKFDEEQIRWIIEQLKETPYGYSIALYCHISPKTSPDMHKNNQGRTNDMINGDNLHQIFADYKKRANSGVTLANGNKVTYDFRGCGGKLAGVFCGHEHEDLYQNVDGVNYFIETATNAQTNNLKPIFSIVMIDGKYNQVRIVRSEGRPTITTGFDGTLRDCK